MGEVVLQHLDCIPLGGQAVGLRFAVNASASPSGRSIVLPVPLPVRPACPAALSPRNDKPLGVACEDRNRHVAHLDEIGEDVPLRRSGWDAESNGACQGPDHV